MDVDRFFFAFFLRSLLEGESNGNRRALDEEEQPAGSLEEDEVENDFVGQNKKARLENDDGHARGNDLYQDDDEDDDDDDDAYEPDEASHPAPTTGRKSSNVGPSFQADIPARRRTDGESARTRACTFSRVPFFLLRQRSKSLLPITEKPYGSHLGLPHRNAKFSSGALM